MIPFVIFWLVLFVTVVCSFEDGYSMTDYLMSNLEFPKAKMWLEIIIIIKTKKCVTRSISLSLSIYLSMCLCMFACVFMLYALVICLTFSSVHFS